MNEVFIVSAKRTPIGGLLGNLAEFSATRLGAFAIQNAYESISLNPEWINSVYMGNVLSAGLGQSPARQAAVFAKIPYDKDATTINKVCSSGIKATILGAQQIQTGIDEIVVTGGMESMSNVPHYTFLRKGIKLGNTELIDGMTKDGLWDPYNDFHMGSAGELGIKKYGYTREQLDNYALSSYKKAQKATENGKFKNELVEINILNKKGNTTIDKDEDIYKLIPEKVSQLKPVFEEGGLLTAANSSNLNDGAAALVLASADAIRKYNLKPLAKIVSYADAAQAPEWFTTSPSVAITRALLRANLDLSEIDYFEVNEAYSSVVLSNQQILGLDPGKINLYGGAVALGHPIGASGARIIVTLLSVLQQEKGKYGVAGICNGGGGASAIVIENLNI